MTRRQRRFKAGTQLLKSSWRRLGREGERCSSDQKMDQIGAARVVIQRCAFNKTLCEDGIDGLIAWEFDWNEETNVFSREPLHNGVSS